MYRVLQIFICHPFYNYLIFGVMEKYESKQQQIHRQAADVYSVMSDFRNFTPVVSDKVEEWSADENSCTFKLQGMKIRVLIVEKEQDSYIKFGGDENSPVEFYLWIQLKEAAPYDTRMRVVVHARLNMMMRMMIGSKLQQGVDKIAEHIAMLFNQPHFPPQQSDSVVQQ